MVLYKQVNGRKVELTLQEEQAVRDEWAANEAIQQQAEQEEQARQALMNSARDKIASSASMSDDEKQAYFNGTY